MKPNETDVAAMSFTDDQAVTLAGALMMSELVLRLPMHLTLQMMAREPGTWQSAVGMLCGLTDLRAVKRVAETEGAEGLVKRTNGNLAVLVKLIMPHAYRATMKAIDDPEERKWFAEEFEKERGL